MFINCSIYSKLACMSTMKNQKTMSYDKLQLYAMMWVDHKHKIEQRKPDTEVCTWYSHVELI